MLARVKKGVSDVVVFFNEVGGELKKSAWPARSELVESTLVVLISMSVLAIVVGFFDQILLEAVKLLSALTG